MLYTRKREIMDYREEVNRLLDVDNQGWGTDDVDRLREIFNKLMNRDDSRRDRERPMTYREEFNKHLDAMVAKIIPGYDETVEKINSFLGLETTPMDDMPKKKSSKGKTSKTKSSKRKKKDLG